jgi:hypothetical protein
MSVFFSSFFSITFISGERREFSEACNFLNRNKLECEFDKKMKVASSVNVKVSLRKIR